MYRGAVSYTLVREQKQQEDHRGKWEPHVRSTALSVRVGVVARTYRRGDVSDRGHRV